MGILMRCPSCKKSNHIHRSRRKQGWERLVGKVTSFRPYRCHHCSTRFWRPAFMHRKGASHLRARTSRSSTPKTGQ